MEEWLNTILADIASGKMLPADYYQQLDCDKLLDARDMDTTFGAEWTRIYREAKGRWSQANIADVLRKFTEAIRRESFIMVGRATNQHEIASYVSDDLDLIARGRLLGLEEKLLEQLWSKYQHGEFAIPPFPREASDEP